MVLGKFILMMNQSTRDSPRWGDIMGEGGLLLPMEISIKENGIWEKLMVKVFLLIKRVTCMLVNGKMTSIMVEVKKVGILIKKNMLGTT